MPSKSLQQRIRRRAITIADQMDQVEGAAPEEQARLIRSAAALSVLSIAASMDSDQDATRLIDSARRLRTK